jgi:hypothetical protein
LPNHVVSPKPSLNTVFHERDFYGYLAIPVVS